MGRPSKIPKPQEKSSADGKRKGDDRYSRKIKIW